MHILQIQLQFEIIVMNFLNLSELSDAVDQHDQFQHEIKGKRVKKQLANLQQYNNQQITFKRYFISLAGLSFFIETHVEHKVYDFQVLIDFQYPFNRPKVFYIHENSRYGYCQDLLDTILTDKNWGPSMLLSGIFDKLHHIATLISKESEEIMAVYQIGDIYEEQILTKYKIQLFQIEQYKWKYLIKSTHPKMMGLTKYAFLIFSGSEEPSKLKLEIAIPMNNLKEANASIAGSKFKLDIVCSESPQSKYYFGGNKDDIEKILYFMNPIQVTERKLSKPEKEEVKSEDLQKVIQQYSDLIEYYSLRDQQKTKKYVNLVQQLIKKNYEQQQIQQPKLEQMKQDIKT